MGALRWPWFRFYVTAHEDGKVAALSDGEFRLWTRVLALARQNEERPGWVWLVEGEGIDPRELAAGARCKSLKDPAAALQRMAKLSLLRLHDGGVIEVMNWEKLNPPPPPSKTKEGRRLQKQKERGTPEENRRQDVARRQAGDTEATGQNVGRGDVEEDVEEEEPPEPPSEIEPRWEALFARLSTAQVQELKASRNALVSALPELLPPAERRFREQAIEDRLFAEWSTVAAPVRAAGGAS